MYATSKLKKHVCVQIDEGDEEGRKCGWENEFYSHRLFEVEPLQEDILERMGCSRTQGDSE